MDIKSIRDEMHRQPFEPFTLELADSRAIHVPHRDFIAVSPTGRTITVYDEDGSSLVIEPLLIVSIERDKRRPPVRRKRKTG